MAKKKHSLYLTDQSPTVLKELVTFLVDRVAELEPEEEFLDSDDLNILPALRGLIDFLKEEHLEEDEEAEEVNVDEDWEETEDNYQEGSDGDEF